MTQLFGKAAVFTDIHFGKKSDSEEHNQDCLDYIDWFCSKVNETNSDTIIFMGDWFDNRSMLRVDTVDYSWQAIQRLMDTKRKIFWLVGNHDMYFKLHRGVHSIPYIQGIEQITLVNEITEIDDVLLCPWLTGDESEEIPKYKSKYVFGHFELPLFLLNEKVTMKDTGKGIHADHFENNTMVFSGHFHTRQMQVNKHNVPIWYIGNCFPHDFNDVNDSDRGCMTLAWGEEPEFHNWDDAPNYFRISMSELPEYIESGKIHEFNKKTIIECVDDTDNDIEDIIGIREALDDSIRDFRVKPKRKEYQQDTETKLEDGLTVDQMVVDYLYKTDTEESKFDTELLVKLYQDLTI